MSQSREMNQMLVGSIAGAAEVLVDHPLWALKTRFQQGQGMTLDPRVLYRGLMPNMASMVPITACQFAANAAVLSVVDNQIAAGFMAGVAAAFIACPVEMAMTRQANTGESFATACRTIGGMRLFTGLPATAFRDGVFTTAIFAGKSMLKPYVSQVIENEKAAGIVGSVTAGVMAAVVTHPVDTIKTAQQSGNARMGFFKGVIPRATRIASAVVMMGEVNERLNRKF